jgi:tetratricopeptide (TPR) repeat protein
MVLTILLIVISLSGIWKDYFIKESKRIPVWIAIILSVITIAVGFIKSYSDNALKINIDRMSNKIDEQHNVIMRKDERIDNLEHNQDSLENEILRIKSKTADINYSFEGYEIRGGKSKPYFLYHELEAKIDTIQKKYQSNLFNEVVNLCDSLGNKYPFFATPVFYKAMAFRKLGLKDSAKTYLKKVIVLESSNREYASAYLYLAEICLNVPNYDSARICLEKGIDYSYDDNDTLYNKNVEEGVIGGEKRSHFLYYYACLYSLLYEKELKKSKTNKAYADSVYLFMERAIKLNPKLSVNVSSEIAFKCLKSDPRFKSIMRQ